MKRILVLLALAAPLLVAQTDRWVYFFTDVDNARSYIDAQTVQYRASSQTGVPNDYVSVWVKIVHSSGTSTLAHNQLHYTTRHVRFLSLVNYDAEGKITYSSYEPGKWVDITPESMGDALLHRLYRMDSTHTD
jgi:hypothetical protein